MANVTLTIGGRKYTLACEPGDESHLQRLAGMIDERIALTGVRGQTEARTMLYAALFLADELEMARNAAPQPADPLPTTAPAPVLPPEFPARLEAIADRIENLASLLESAPENA